MEALAETAMVEIAAFALTGRNTAALRRVLPSDVQHNTLPMPASVLTRVWRHANFPRLDAWMSADHVVHGTNFVVPPTRRAGRLVTVHDLTAVRYPQLCTPASRRYPDLLRRAIKNGAHVHTL